MGSVPFTDICPNKCFWCTNVSETEVSEWLTIHTRAREALNSNSKVTLRNKHSTPVLYSWLCQYSGFNLCRGCDVKREKWLTVKRCG